MPSKPNFNSGNKEIQRTKPAKPVAKPVAKPNLNKPTGVTYDREKSYVDPSLFNENQTNVGIDEDFDFVEEASFPKEPNNSKNKLQGTIQNSTKSNGDTKVGEVAKSKQVKETTKQPEVVVDTDDWNGSLVSVESKTKKNKKDIAKEKAQQKKLKKYNKKQALAGRAGHENDTVEEDVADKIKAKLPLIGGIIGGVAVIASVLFMFRDSFDGKTLTEAAVAPEVTVTETEQEVADATETVETAETAETEHVTEESVETEQGVNETVEEVENVTDIGVINQTGTALSIPVIVNTKLADDDAYTDHESTVSIKLNPIVVDAETVGSYVDEYNEYSTDAVIDKEQLVADETTFGVYEAILSIPETYPTIDELGDKSYFKPVLTLSIVGTEEPDSIITEKYVVKAPSAVNISAFNSEELNVGETYTYRWIVPMANGTEADDYNVVLTVEASEIENGACELTFEGESILGE